MFNALTVSKVKLKKHCAHIVKCLTLKLMFFSQFQKQQNVIYVVLDFDEITLTCREILF